MNTIVMFMALWVAVSILAVCDCDESTNLDDVDKYWGFYDYLLLSAIAYGVILLPVAWTVSYALEL